MWGLGLSVCERDMWYMGLVSVCMSVCVCLCVSPVCADIRFVECMGRLVSLYMFIATYLAYLHMHHMYVCAHVHIRMYSHALAVWGA